MEKTISVPNFSSRVITGNRRVAAPATPGLSNFFYTYTLTVVREGRLYPED